MTTEKPPLERAALALQEEAGKFEAPVQYYVWREAARRWEEANPGSFWEDASEHEGLNIETESWKILARAVLEAIREPSKGMVAAGSIWVQGADYDVLEGAGRLMSRDTCGNPSGLEDVWQAMIDAALSE